jgi:hypothetical protein
LNFSSIARRAAAAFCMRSVKLSLKAGMGLAGRTESAKAGTPLR